ncbi:MAG: hypothetical protein AAGB46_09980 [Verrucomicrobiota bacterium]
MGKPLVYLVFGSLGSGRRSVVADLIEFGAEMGSSTKVFVSGADWEGQELDLGTKSRESVISEYALADKGLGIPGYVEEGDMCFVVADGRSDPADFMEAFSWWLSENEAELGRVITVMDCALCAEKSKVLVWYDCCIYFSDIVLLANRHGVSPKWVGDLQEKYKKELCYPCMFEFVKKGRVGNPALVLDPTARRMTGIFDDPRDYMDVDEDPASQDSAAASEEEDVTFYDMSPEDAEQAFEEMDEREVPAVNDPYLEKLPSGRRAKVLPDIRKLLG